MILKDPKMLHKTSNESFVLILAFLKPLFSISFFNLGQLLDEQYLKKNKIIKKNSL